MLRTDRSDEGRICLLGLEGSLTSSDLVNLAERLRGLAARGMLRVVVDLRQVDHWDFRGLKCLVEAVEYRRRTGGVTAFITPNRYLRDIAAAVGAADRLEFYDELRVENEVELFPLMVPGVTGEDAELRRA
jgi:anti-anti-sigma regulatory factor